MHNLIGMRSPNILKPCLCYNGNTVTEAEVSEKETGFDRVKRMYQLNDYGLMSPEMFFLIRNATTTVAVTSVIGACVHASKVRENFFRRNTETKFESQYLAKRNLTDTVSKAALKGGFQYACKYGSFSSAYLLSTMTVATYNNKITVWEHIGTGAVLGGILRFNFGLKGMAAAASVGGFLGALAGGISILFLKLCNLTLEDIRNMESEKYYSIRRKRCQES